MRQRDLWTSNGWPTFFKFNACNAHKHVRVWDQLQNSDLPPPQEDMAKWEAEFSQLMNSHRDELEDDFGTNMQSAWEGGVGNFDDSLGASMKFDGEGIPILGDYVFGKSLLTTMSFLFF